MIDLSWIVGLAITAISFIGLIYVMRYMVGELKKSVDTIYRRLDKHGDDIIRLNTKSELAVTAKDVDEKFVSKELFKQYEKHIDSRFDVLENGQGKILKYIKKEIE